MRQLTIIFTHNRMMVLCLRSRFQDLHRILYNSIQLKRPIILGASMNKIIYVTRTVPSLILVIFVSILYGIQYSIYQNEITHAYIAWGLLAKRISISSMCKKIGIHITRNLPIYNILWTQLPSNRLEQEDYNLFLIRISFDSYLNQFNALA